MPFSLTITPDKIPEDGVATIEAGVPPAVDIVCDVQLVERSTTQIKAVQNLTIDLQDPTVGLVGGVDPYYVHCSNSAIVITKVGDKFEARYDPSQAGAGHTH